MLDAFAHFFIVGDLAAKPTYLRPAGDSRLDVVPAGILRDAPFIELIMDQRVRPRTDKRHFAGQYVDKLRQFIDAEASQEVADARDARVVARRRLQRRSVLHRLHRAKFIDSERLLIKAIAPLKK